MTSFNSGSLQYNEVVDAFDRPEVWKALVAESTRLKRLEPLIKPWELDIEEINRALGQRFHSHDELAL